MEKDEGERGEGESETLLLPSLYGGGGSGVRTGEGESWAWCEVHCNPQTTARRCVSVVHYLAVEEVHGASP